MQKTLKFLKSPITGAEKKAFTWLKEKTRDAREVRVKNTNKNLGYAVISNDWYVKERYRQLNDPTTYSYEEEK